MTAAPTNTQGERINYTELSAAELAKLINDEYSYVLAAERSNLPRARAIGEKLEALRAGTPHGEWQKKLKKWCPKISYETANRYIKLYLWWPKIEQNAAVKNVKTTDLTIDDALKLLAKPPKTPNDEASDASKASRGGVEPPEIRTSEDIGKEWLRALAVDELVSVLKEIHRNDTEYLQELSAALTKTLTPPTVAPTVSAVGMERRL
jgi:Protein of unknown function (DUF3102)